MKPKYEKPKYEYFVIVDDKSFPVPITVKSRNDEWCLKMKGVSPSFTEFSEEDVYKTFEKHLHKNSMDYAITGDLSRLIPGYKNSNTAEAFRIVRIPRRTWWRKTLQKIHTLLDKNPELG